MASSLESLLTSLQSNSITRLVLSLGGRADMAGLLQALEINTSVEEANVDIYEAFQQRANAHQEVMELFSTLSRRPNLKRLFVDSGREDSPFFSLCVAALSLVLRQAPQLRKLALYNVELACITNSHQSEDEWHQFEAAVAEHPSLQTFGLVGCRLAEELLQNDSQVFTLERLVGTSLATLATLQWVELTGQGWDALGELSPASLEALCQSASLTKLTLDYFDLKDQHIAAMSRALETSRTLEEWKITCDLGRMGCTALAQLLFVNTSLNNFMLKLNELIQDEDEDIATQQLSKETNNNQEKKDAIYCVTQALERNQTLQYFCLCGYATISKTSHEAFATLLRHNTTLLHCEIDLERAPGISDDLQYEAELMLKLNELGRKQLLQGRASPHKWVMTLWEVRHKLDGLYYLLSRNPMLCDVNTRPKVQMDKARRPTYSHLNNLQFKYMLS